MVKSLRFLLFGHACHLLFRFIFQPLSFHRQYEQLSFWQRVGNMIQLLLPIILFSCVISYLGRYLLWWLVPSFYNPCLLRTVVPTDTCFILDTIRGSLWGTIGGIIGGSLFGVSFGTAFSLAGGIAGGLVVDTKNDIASSGSVGLIFGLSFGICLGLLLGLTTKRQRNRRGLYLLRTITSNIIGLVFGGIGGLAFGFIVTILIGRIDGAELTENGTTGSIGGLIGGVASAVIMSLLCQIIEDLMRSSRASIRMRQVIQIMRIPAIAFAGIVGTAAGTIGILAVARNLSIAGLFVNIQVSIEVCLLAGTAFCLSYIFGYYRLPLYPFTGLAMLFIYLRYRFCSETMILSMKQSPLYWDELAFLPYPLLKICLRILYYEGRVSFFEQCHFIISERPEQIPTAIVILEEIALRELLPLQTMLEIAQAKTLLSALFPSEIRYFNDDDPWFKPFFTLEKISHDAEAYLGFQSPQAKLETLSDMMADLNKLKAHNVEGTRQMKLAFSKVLRSWNQTVRACKITQKELDNPYKPGQILPPNDKTFVGRFDMAQTISSAIQKHHCTAFFLEGERRIGKSSILQRLPGMLGGGYLRVLLSLENTAMLASSATFFYHVARGIYYELASRSTNLKKLSFEELKEASYLNEHMVYFVFGEWLALVEQFLKHERYTLLLCFDEFENINNAQFERGLLFGWLRELIQFHHHFILFFCGRRPRVLTVNWSSYFVNVETQHVGVLHPEEVHELVTRPVAPNIFNPSSIQEIIYLTGCHPFLVQALCSKLIINLNDTNRHYADLTDVEIAAQDVVEAYIDYFIEQWERCSELQQRCLLWLSNHQQNALIANLTKILGCTRSELAEVLRELQLRELLHYDQETCTLAIPLFQRWLQTNNLT